MLQNMVAVFSPAEKFIKKTTTVAFSSPVEKDKVFRKILNRRNGEPYYRPLGEKVIQYLNATVKLASGKNLRKYYIAIRYNSFKQPKSSLIIHNRKLSQKLEQPQEQPQDKSLRAENEEDETPT